MCIFLVSANGNSIKSKDCHDPNSNELVIGPPCAMRKLKIMILKTKVPRQKGFRVLAQRPGEQQSDANNRENKP